MRRTLSLAIGTGATAAAAIMVAGLASAASGTTHQAARPAAAAVNKLITRAQAVRIAEAKVPHSRAIEVQSDDLHDRAVWKVTLAIPHGRVIVDVDKHTGRATIVRHGGSGGSDDAAVMARHSVRTHTASTSAAGWSGRDAREHARDRADQDQGDRDRAGRDQGDQDRGGHGDQDGHRGQHRGDQREAERGDR
jgi:Peptidase propeptide and YPEB domain